MRKVNVLISTYNGALYLREQIDSVLAQSYPDIDIYVRDDGSRDDTLSILHEYEQAGQVTLFQGENVGYGKSFLELLNLVPDNGYYAYCDQDDVWCVDRIEGAVKWLDKQGGPAMYHGSFYNTNEALEIIDTCGPTATLPRFSRTITDCVHLGFSMVMNQKLRQLVLKGQRNNLVTHDWWTELVAMEFATIFFDEKIGTYHRRLDNSISVMSMKSRIGWLKRALKGNAEIRSCTAEFNRVFGQQAKKEHLKVIHWFCDAHYHIGHALCKTFYPHRWRPTMSSELVVRCLMLIGRI